MVAALFVLGQREQRLGERPGAVDQALTDAVIGDDREAEALERAAERRSEPIRVARLIGEAECRNMGGGGIEHGHPIRVRETNHYRCPPSPRTAGQPLMTIFPVARSEEHTSELQSLMRISYAVFCLKKNIL